MPHSLYEGHLAETFDYLSVSWATSDSHLLAGSGRPPPERRQLDNLGFSGTSLFWTYIIFLAIHVTVSSLAILLFPGSGILRVHFGSMVVSLIVLVTGFVVYGKLLQLQLMDAYEMRTRTEMQSMRRHVPTPNGFAPLLIGQNGLRCLSATADSSRRTAGEFAYFKSATRRTRCGELRADFL